TNSSYDAYGNLVVDWTTDGSAGTDRGFTGHEHLDDLGIIHMNGRLYDPNIGRMMQPDPFVQEMLNLQNYDRYGYCFNSPLICTDPTGYSFLSKIWKKIMKNPILRIAVMVVVNMYVPGALLEFGITNGFANAAMSGFISGAISSGNLKGALQGAFTAGAFNLAGDLITQTGAFSGSGMGGWGESSWQAVAVHGVVGCVTTAAGGGKCGAGMLSAAFSQATLEYKNSFGDFIGNQAVGGTIASAVIGGTASVLGGGKFSNGAQTAAFGYLFNWLAHIGVKLKVPFVGGASFGIGVSKTNGSWDAGIIIDSDIPVVSAGKLLGKTAVEVGLQEGDFMSNKAEQSLSIEAGYKAVGVGIQKSADGRVTGGTISFGPQLGVAVGGQQTRTLSIRNEVVPAVKSAVDKVKSWFGP
ncbi:hypothetical protein CDN99_24585, partial [Roseateles aquatilis]